MMNLLKEKPFLAKVLRIDGLGFVHAVFPRYPRKAIFLGFFLVASCATVKSDLNYSPRKSFLSNTCFELSGKFEFVNLDTSKIVSSQNYRVPARGTFEVIEAFIEDAFRAEGYSNIHPCSGLGSGMGNANQIVIDSIFFLRRVPSDSYSGGSMGKGIAITYHSGYRLDSDLYFRIRDGADSGKGRIEYRTKMVGDDWNETRGAIRLMVRKLVKAMRG